MKKRYYINGELFESLITIPKDIIDITYWMQSATKLKCEKDDLDNIEITIDSDSLNPIDVTEITTVKNGKVYFKEVESEVNEAVYTLEEIIFGVRKMLKLENIRFDYVREELPRFLEESKKEIFNHKNKTT